jgi:cytochrome c553
MRRIAGAVLAALVLWAGCAVAQSITLPERIRQCDTCHGENGNSRLANMPSLAGQPEFFIFNQLFLMREGVRRIESMMPLVKDLKDQELFALARHYAGLSAVASDEPIDAALARRGGELAPLLRCGSCHLPTFLGREQVPRLAKQRIDYLIHSLRALRDNTRSGADTLMSNVVAGLTDGDLAALAHYTGSR